MDEGEEIRFIDLFSGVGGFRRGLEEANREIWDGLQNLEARGGSSDASIRVRKRRIQSKNTPCDIGLEDCGRSQSHREDHRSAGNQFNSSRRENEHSSPRSFRCAWSCDNNRYANQIYIKQFGEANHNSGDIRGVDPRDIPDFDLLCAGFPCQSFSVAGKGKGFQDTRGTLFFEISRIAEAKRPQMLLLENVRGLLSNDRGQTFETILQELGRIGYWTEWQVLNSKHFGVPQSRQRVFIIGHSRNGSTRPIFPIGESNQVSAEELRGQRRIASCLDSNYWKGARRQRTFVIDTFNRGGIKEDETYSLKTNPSITSSAVVALRQVGTLGKDDQASRIYSTEGLSPTIPTPGGGHHMPKIIANTVDQDGYLRFGHRPRDENGKPQLIPIGYRRIRRLTPVECERLQAFPDGWTEWGIDEDGNKVKISDTQRYKMLGNAVTTNVITFLGHRIMEAWE